MGQVLTTIQEKFQGKEWKERQIRKIPHKAFDCFRNDYGKDHLSFEDLYIMVLFVYNDINKYLPGSHNDPPSKQKVLTMMETYDLNLDGMLDREEFATFIKKLTSDTLTQVSTNLLIALLVAPAVALMTKRATEGMPVVGTVVQKIPASIYASLVALGVVMLQDSKDDFE
ncbi:hypothetical protein QJS10_CPA10g01316 [Acorus calamus]|uniref:EF-hand domain-containing protein n=1 Tax=Acorus calamus TaxID=4465 RepID=A0AAV9E261_ACOCL|nr:hypothetical protein QJS10_CPA10g01316 [Acorus calamus]